MELSLELRFCTDPASIQQPYALEVELP